jgi:putative membrane protein
MILPGISGSFLLLLLGKYAFILDALYQVTRYRKIDHHLTVVLVFILGCACGIMAFSRVLNWMFNRYHAMTLATLTGLMLGSLRRIWPFQTGGEEMAGAQWMVSNYLWPFEKEIMFNIQKKSLFLQNTWPSQWNSQYLLAIVLVVFGIIFVFSIDHFAEKREDTTQ